MPRTPVSIALAAALACGLSVSCARTAPTDAATAPAPSAPAPAATAPPAAPASTDGVHRFRIGALEAVALRDGTLQVPNDGKTFAVGEPVEAVAKLLAAAGQPTDTLSLSLQPLLVRAGERVLLFDTGGGPDFPQGGQLGASMAAAGVAPDAVTDVLISHKHGDHVGGLVTADGKPAFPNATIHLSAAEWAAFQADASVAPVAKAVAAQVKPFAAGAELVPGVVTAVADAGHTPGHSAYLIGSVDDRLLYVGDTVHHFVVSMQEPEWTIAFDEDEAAAERQRRALLQRAADENLRTYAVHFPFPGLGRVQAQGTGFAWTPEP